MINKFFTNPGRFIKMFFAITAIVFFAWGPVGMNTVSAGIFANEPDIEDYLIPKDSSWTDNLKTQTTGPIKKDNLSLEESVTTGATTATIQINLNPAWGSDVDNDFPVDTNSSTKFDCVSGVCDKIGNFWKTIFEPDDLKNDGTISTDDGVYLSIFQAKDNIATKENQVDYIINKELTTTKGVSPNYGKNITPAFFKTSQFFTTKTYGTKITIGNLQPNTEYKARVFVEENGSLDYYWSEQVITFTTKTAGSGDLDINEPQGNTGNNQAQSILKGGYECSNILDVACGIIKAYAFIITLIPNLIAAVTGTIADYVMNLSIGHGVYQYFLEKTFDIWKIVRDLSNLFIILSLFVAAFSLIIGGNNDDSPEIVQKFGDPKKMIVRAITVALFINFSFFFSRIIIDTGNVTARFFYNQIGVTGSTGSGSVVVDLFKSEEDTVKDISIAMLSQVQPQKLILGEITPGSTEGNAAYLVSAHLTFFASLVFIYLFLIIGVLFLGRMIMLVLLTILSPIAFATLPFSEVLKSQKYVGFKDWLKQISGNAFLGTVYFFFVYLAIIMTNISIEIQTDSSWGGAATNTLILIAGMFFKLGVMFFVLFYGKKIAMEMSGIIGEYVTKYAGMATNLAMGAATGGTALLARQTLGAAGSAVAGSGWANRLASSNNGIVAGIGRGFRSGGAAVGATSFDVRNSPGIMNRFNQATNALGGGKIEMGEKGLRNGGYAAEGSLKEQYDKRQKAIEENKIKQREERAKELEQLARERHQPAITNADKSDKKAQEALNREKTNQENSVHDFRANSSHMQAVQQRVDTEVAGLTADEAKLTSAIQALEQEVNNLPQNSPAEKEIHRKKSQELTNMKDEQALITKTIAAANQHKNDQVSVATQMQAKGYSSIEQMSESKKQLEERAGNSAEKSKLDKEKADLEKEKTKAKELGNELKEAIKQNNQAEITRLNTELAAQNTKVNTAQQNVTTAKTNYETTYGNAIKALEDDIKNFSSKIKNSDYNKTRTQLAQHKATTATQNLREVNSVAQQDIANAQVSYAQDLENRGTGTLRRATSVITNGNVFGGTTNNANQTAAQNIRDNINRRP